jgi:hypothetical protein
LSNINPFQNQPGLNFDLQLGRPHFVLSYGHPYNSSNERLKSFPKMSETDIAVQESTHVHINVLSQMPQV